MGHVTERATDGSERSQTRYRQSDLVLLTIRCLDERHWVLRESAARQNLPVVIITAYGTIERAVEAVKAGANDFITKPFDPEHLAWWSRGVGTSAAQVRSGILRQELGGRYRLVAGRML
jgi:DNA-binding NtrC family response regulator